MVASACCSSQNLNLLSLKKEAGSLKGILETLFFSSGKNTSSAGMSITESKNKNVNISLYPTVGYFITDKFVIGATVNFTYKYSKTILYNNNGSKSSESIGKSGYLGLIPFVRYYLAGSDSKNRFYLQAGGGMSISLFDKYKSIYFNNFGNIQAQYDRYSFDQHQVYAEGLVGFNHFFTENIAFNSAIGYSYSRVTLNYKMPTYSPSGTLLSNEQKNVNQVGSLLWNVGFTIIIPHKKAETASKK